MCTVGSPALKFAERCGHCICLYEGDNGAWMCDELEMQCDDIFDCPEGMELKEVRVEEECMDCEWAQMEVGTYQYCYACSVRPFIIPCNHYIKA